MITTWNLAAERIYGYHAEEVIGRDSVLLAPSPAHHRVMCEMLGRVGRGEKRRALRDLAANEGRTS